jgi:ActR/RegA family two-component response regulator
VTRPRVVILADDLIWRDRLSRALEEGGAEPVPARTAAQLAGSLGDADFVVIDLTSRAYDPLAAIDTARSAGARVLAVGQHDDLELRKLALGRGAEKVLAYRKLFEDGPGTFARWLGLAVDAVTG